MTDRQSVPDRDLTINTVGSGPESAIRDGSGAALLRFAGTMDPEVAREIAAAIEEDRERIENDDDPGG